MFNILMTLEMEMNSDRSRSALVKFLEYTASKGLAPGSTVAARKAAVNKVLGILSDDESVDITTIDLSLIMGRFNNLHGQSYTPDSLNTYKSRVRSSIDDFNEYLANPLGFRPNRISREKPVKQQATKPLSATSDNQNTSPVVALSTGARSVPMSDTILPIPLRPDLVVYIQGLPFNLSKAEASKISAVVLAMAASYEN
jgi:hypothetical protein